MDQSISEMHQLLVEVTGHLKSEAKPDKSVAVSKLGRVAALASTLAFTIQCGRR